MGLLSLSHTDSPHLTVTAVPPDFDQCLRATETTTSCVPAPFTAEQLRDWVRAPGVPITNALVTPDVLEVLAKVCVAVHGTPGELINAAARVSREE